MEWLEQQALRLIWPWYSLYWHACVGWIEVVAFTVGPSCLKPEDLGIANGILGPGRGTLSSVAQAVFATILDNKLITNIPKYVIPAALDAGLPEASSAALLEGPETGNFTGVPSATAAVIAAAVDGNRKAYEASFKVVFLASIAFGLFGLCAAFFVPNVDSKFTAGISRRLHGSKLNGEEMTTELQSA